MLSNEVHLICSTVVPSAKRCPPLHQLVIDVELFNDKGVGMLLFFCKLTLVRHGMAKTNRTSESYVWIGNWPHIADPQAHPNQPITIDNQNKLVIRHANASTNIKQSIKDRNNRKVNLHIQSLRRSTPHRYTRPYGTMHQKETDNPVDMCTWKMFLGDLSSQILWSWQLAVAEGKSVERWL